MGKKVGYVREVETKGSLLTEAGWSLNRAGIPLIQSLRSEVRLDASGRPRSFETIQYDGVQEKRLEGQVESSLVKLRSIVSGTTTERQVALPEGTFFGNEFPFRLRERLRQGVRASGENWSVFLEDSGLVMTLTTSVSQPISITIGRQPETVQPTDVVYAGLGISGKWYFRLPTFELIRQETNFSGILLVMNLSNKEEALKSDGDSGRDAPDLLLSFRVPVDRPLSLGPKENSAKFMLGSKNERDLQFPSDLRQSYDAKTRLLTLREFPKRSWILKRPVTQSDLAPFLQPTEYEQTTDPEIRRLADHLAGSEPTAWGAAKKLMAWVHRHISDKGYAVGFASAKEVLTGRRGDCTEHAVLLGALCKAAGIPTRTVVGLIGQGEWFLYHMWVECFVGEWLPLDAAFNQAPVDVWHIKYRDGLLDDAGFFSMGVAMLPLLNNIELKFLRDSPPKNQKAK